MTNILLWDLETTPNRGFFWGIFNQQIQYNAIDKERSIICGSFKNLGNDKITTVSLLDYKKRLRNDVYDDYEVVKDIHKILSSADVLIGHNADKYDLKFFNSRAVFHGLKPIPTKIPSVDTLKVAKKHFRFNSNRLDYLGDYLDVGTKLKTSSGLWLKIVKDSTSFKDRCAAIQEMVNYNKRDVILLEDVYNKLLPYMDNHPNMNIIKDLNGHACKNCGSLKVHKNGFVRTKVGSYQRYHCQDCGSWSQGKENLSSTVLR
jgi:RNase P subunit RPR2